MSPFSGTCSDEHLQTMTITEAGLSGLGRFTRQADAARALLDSVPQLTAEAA